MDTENPGAREMAVSLLLPLFFLSGATALTYQTLWVGELELVFGTSTFAIATVLSAFMAGLAAGGFLCARYADKLARPLQAYGVLEIGIGLYALLFPVLVSLVTPAYLSVWRALEPGPVMYGVVQFALVGVLLIAPTAMMGATLPLLARFATHRIGSAGDRIGTLYAINTAGAVFGTWLCGFVLLPGIGRFSTTVAAALANLLLGAAAVALDRWAQGDSQAPEDDLEQKAAPSSSLLGVVSLAIGIAGFSALVYEVAWTRLLALMLGASTYTFSVMLLAFLVGIALGGKLGGPLADNLLARGGLRHVLLAFAAIEVGIAVVSYLLMYIYPELPFWYVWIFDFFQSEEYPKATWAVSLGIAGLIMTPPAVLMGMHFPVAVRAVLSSPDALGAPVGRVYGANTLGGVLGAFLAGFFLLPTFQVQGTIFVAGAAELLAAAMLVLYAEQGQQGSARWRLAVPLGAVGLIMAMVARKPPWDPMLMTAGMYHYVSHFSDHSREGILDYSVSQYELVFYEEGLSSVVTVAKNRDSGNMWLANNGKVDASTTTDLPTQVLCSLLPMMFVEKPDDVMVIGLASGITAGAVSLVPTVGKLDVVELEPAIEKAARLFGEHNHEVLDDPRVNLIVNDGRNQVLLSPERSYDVIVSEPPNPWISGVSNLFTQEFWELGKTRLKPGGVWSQWVQMYGMDTDDLRMLLRTFAEVYPHVLVYATIEDADLVLVGSESELRPGPDLAAKLFRWPRVVDELGKVDIEGPMGIVALYQLDRAAILELAGPGEFNTDDNMAIEYSAPLNLHVETSADNFELLLKHAQIPKDALPPDVDVWAYLARTYRERDDVVRAVASMVIAARMLPEGDERRQELLAEATQWSEEMQSEEGAEEEGGS
jgi:spermidine synthase